MRHDGLALTGGKHVGAQADDAARGNVELYVHTVAEGYHRGHLALAARYHVDHLRGELLRDVDCQFFNRLATLAVDFLIDYLRLPYLQFVALAAHRLDED